MKRLKDINELLNKIKIVLDSGSESKIRLNILKLRPWIAKHIQLSSVYLNYDEANEYFFMHLQSVLSSLQMERDKLAFLVKEPLSLKEAILNSFLVPSKILGWFGLNLNLVSSKIFSAAFFILGFILKSYGKDIINWFTSLL
ncbi:hypothetical protein HRD84_08845 [Enterococcus faecalis]|nr:hypothetical protein [Enterococcus faecalis]